MATLVRTTPAATGKSNSVATASRAVATPARPVTATAQVATAAKPAAKPQAVAQSQVVKPAAVQPKPTAKPIAASASAAQAGEVTELAKPKKPRIGMSEEEVAAAVEGELEPRETKGTADQSALTETDEFGRAKGRPIGISTGLPILGAWCYVFQENEKNADDEKLTDEQITIWMQEEFPGRDTPAFLRPAGCREDYNRGKFTKLIKPKIESKRYNADGTIYIKPPRANPFQKKAVVEGTPEGTVAAEGTEQTKETVEQVEQGNQVEGAEVVEVEAPAPTPAPVVTAKPKAKSAAKK